MVIHLKLTVAWQQYNLHSLEQGPLLKTKGPLLRIGLNGYKRLVDYPRGPQLTASNGPHSSVSCYLQLLLHSNAHNLKCTIYKPIITSTVIQSMCMPHAIWFVIDNRKHQVTVTSSNRRQIIVNADTICWVVPVTVTILSGQEASDMFILAPLCGKKFKQYKTSLSEI